MKDKWLAGTAVRRLTEPLLQAIPGMLQTTTWFALGVLLAQMPVLGSCRPFAAAWTAAVPMAGLGAGTAGSLLGALLHGFDGAPAACAVLLVSSVRWMLSEWKSLSIHPLFSPGCAAGAVLMTELLIRRVVSPSETLGLCICQSMLAGGGTWFFARAAELFVPDGWIRGSTAARWGGILLASCGLATLTGVQWWNISPGGAAAMFAVAVCAHRKHTAGGSVSGTVLGSVFALSAGNPGLYYLGIGGIGMIAGCFAPLGRMAMAMTLPLTAGILVLLSSEAPVGLLWEAVVGAALFMLIPLRWMEQMEKILFYEREEASPQYMRRSVVMRLDFASRAIAHVSQSVEEVSQALLKQCPPTMDGVYERATEECCAGCGLRLLCWQTHYDDNRDAMHRMTPILRERGRVDPGDLPPGLQVVCKRKDRLAAAVTAYYTDHMNHQAEEQRITELRSIVSAQYRGLSDMLAELAESFRQQAVCDEKSSRAVRTYLESAGANPTGVVCSTDENGRMRLEVCARWKTGADGEALRRPLEQLCGRRFGPAGVIHSDGVTRMTFSERAVLQAETGWAQHICRGAQLCGDHYEFFHDGGGRAVMVLSDGMGSGGRAAVDSAMTCGILSRLVLSGLGYDCALRMINSSLYIKPGDESLATVDIATVDLYTGQTVFRKAGAAVGFVRRGNEVETIDLASLPAGILQDVQFASTERVLKPGDWVVLVSDGAVVSGMGWLTECIRTAEGTPQQLCDAILQGAEALRQNGHDDDITAAVLRLKAG
jgi:stage II sporulation protein E